MTDWDIIRKNRIGARRGNSDDKDVLETLALVRCKPFTAPAGPEWRDGELGLDRPVGGDLEQFAPTANHDQLILEPTGERYRGARWC